MPKIKPLIEVDRYSISICKETCRYFSGVDESEAYCSLNGKLLSNLRLQRVILLDNEHTGSETKAFRAGPVCGEAPDA